MAAYLRFYQFNSSPFDGSVAKKGMVLGTQSLRGALSQVKHGLEEAAPRICLTGPDGVGKTSFCRALPKLLAQEAQVAVVLDPKRSWDEVESAAAKKLGVEGGAMTRKALMKARQSGKRLVLVIDQAELLSHESLDRLDILLQYKSDDGKQLLHCVMLANLEAAASGAEVPLLWWLDRFTTLQLQFSPIPLEGLRHYVEKHLAKAGWAGGELFTPDALRAIHCNTGGVPRAINELCQRILIEGGIRGLSKIDEELIEQLCGSGIQHPSSQNRLVESADLSVDLSIGDFGTSPTAQQMLDDPSAQAALDAAPDLTVDRDALLEQTQDIATLLVTQDSPEPLRTVSRRPEASSSTEGIELEDDPAKRNFDDFYTEARSIGAPIGMNRSQSSGRVAKPKSGGMVIAVLVLAAVSWFIYSQRSVSKGLIQSAENKIEKVLEKAPKLARKSGVAGDEDDLEEEGEVEDTASNLPPSLLDRADELAAEGAIDRIGAREFEPGSDGEDPGADVTRQRSDGSEAEATSSAQEAAVARARPTAAPNSAATKATKPVSPQFSDELLVINEYTAIPEAASSAPKLPLPVDDEDEQGDRAEQTGGDGLAAKPMKNKSEPAAPARIAPTRDTPSSRGASPMGR